MTEPMCRTCQYARELPVGPTLDVRQGRPLACHRYPPTAHILLSPNGQHLTLSVFPPIQAQHWCGDYQKTDHPLSLGAS